jgi:DNA-binding response OmpR family regulator
MNRGYILVVEDDPDISNMLRLYFTGEGYNVTITAHGKQAQALCHQERPDLIILDIMLPDTDGFAVFQQLRMDPYTKPIPVIFLTQKDGRADQLAGLELGASDYITKPFELRELKLRVKNLLQTTKQKGVNPRVSYMGRLLVVEDNLDLATILHTFLTDLGYQTDIAVTGKAALDACQQKLYDLIVLDVQLPDIEGYEVIKMLRQNIRTSRTPIMFLSHRSERGDRLKGLELGADDYMTKPFDIDELHLRVRNLIQRTTHLPLDLETTLPNPHIVEEELNGLHHYHGWTVLLVELSNSSDATELARSLSQMPARFIGRWNDRDFVLIVDKGQADTVYQRLQTADIPLKIGRVREDDLEGENVEATAVIQAAQREMV